MKTIRIARVVKYKSVVYPANTDIVVEDADVPDMLSRGGWVINKGPADESSVEDAVGTMAEEAVEEGAEDVGSEEVDEEAKAEAEAEEKELKSLRAKAKKLGIEVNPNWSATKLKKRIAAVEAE